METVPWLANLGNPAMSPQVQGRKQAPSTPFSKAVEIGKEVGGNHYKLSPHECEIPRKDGCIGGGAGGGGGGGQRHFLGEAPLFWIYLTLLVTMVIIERTFSALRQLKNYLRSTMMQECLNN